MRIFQVSGASTNVSIPANSTWHRNLYEPLVEMGHDVVLWWSPALQQAAAGDGNARDRASDELLKAFRNAHAEHPVDLFFAYLNDGMVHTEALDQVRQSGVPTCNFSCNNIHQFYLVDEISPHFDYNLHAEKAAREKFVAVGANPLWWPMASNPRYFRPYDLSPTVDVSFVGANYALRARYIHHLLENGVDVHAYGPGWTLSQEDKLRQWLWRQRLLVQALLARDLEAQARATARAAQVDAGRLLRARHPDNVHAPVSDEELIALYSRSQISLGFLEVYEHHDPSRPVTQHLHLREFEAPMSGALYCTGYMDELAEFFEPDREVIVYRNQHELLDKVRFYLAHPAEAEAIRQAGHHRALAEHTYHHRYRGLFHELGLEGR